MITQEELVEFGKELKGISTYLENLARVLVEEVSQKTMPEETQAPQLIVDERPTVALVEVRSVLATKSQEGKTPAVRELLTKYGASKLSDIDASQYASLLKDAEVL